MNMDVLIILILIEILMLVIIWSNILMELKKDSLGRSKRRRSTGKKIALLSRKEGFEDGFLGFLILIFRVFVFYILSNILLLETYFSQEII